MLMQISPEAGFVIKTRSMKDSVKVFVNVCQHERIGDSGFVKKLDKDGNEVHRSRVLLSVDRVEGWGLELGLDEALIMEVFGHVIRLTDGETFRLPRRKFSSRRCLAINPYRQVEGLNIPMSVGPPCVDRDNAGEECIVYDVIINPKVLRCCRRL